MPPPYVHSYLGLQEEFDGVALCFAMALSMDSWKAILSYNVPLTLLAHGAGIASRTLREYAQSVLLEIKILDIKVYEDSALGSLALSINEHSQLPTFLYTKSPSNLIKTLEGLLSFLRHVAPTVQMLMLRQLLDTSIDVAPLASLMLRKISGISLASLPVLKCLYIDITGCDHAALMSFTLRVLPNIDFLCIQLESSNVWLSAIVVALQSVQRCPIEVEVIVHDMEKDFLMDRDVVDLFLGLFASPPKRAKKMRFVFPPIRRQPHFELSAQVVALQQGAYITMPGAQTSRFDLLWTDTRQSAPVLIHTQNQGLLAVHSNFFEGGIVLRIYEGRGNADDTIQHVWTHCIYLDFLDYTLHWTATTEKSLRMELQSPVTSDGHVQLEHMKLYHLLPLAQLCDANGVCHNILDVLD